MILSNFHTHTKYCDGKNSPEEIIAKAIDKGFKMIGFSGHSYTDFDTSYCMSLNNTLAYKKEIQYLKQKYADCIKIFCGVEQEYYSLASTDGYDFVIGSVHYVLKGGKYIPIDESADILINAVSDYYNGDVYSLIEDYYALVSNIVKKTKADIIGHFDLITKFNETTRLFDEQHPRYQAAVNKALDALIKTGVPFEVNTGAISRGYKSQAFPSDIILGNLAARNAEVVLSSDCHDSENLDGYFDMYYNKLKSMKLNIKNL